MENLRHPKQKSIGELFFNRLAFWLSVLLACLLPLLSSYDAKLAAALIISICATGALASGRLKPIKRHEFTFWMFTLLGALLIVLNRRSVGTASLLLDLIGAALVYTVFSRTPNDKREWITIGNAYSVGCTIAAGVVALNWIIGNATESGRYTVGETNPNFIAYALATGTAIIYTTYCNTRRTNTSILLTLFAVIMIGLGILLTGSRGASIAYLIMLFIFSIRNLTRKKIVRTIILISASATIPTLLYLTLPETIQSRLIATDAETLDDLSSGRAVQWALAFDLISKEPTIGHGVNMFAKEYGDDLQLHNVFLNIAVELGIPALLLYTLGIKSILSHPLSAISERKNKLAILGLFFSWLIIAMTGVWAYAPAAWFAFGWISTIHTYQINTTSRK